MKTVTFDEFENAKLEIIRGVEYHEDTSTTQYGMAGKTYTTEKSGTFYEVTDPNKPGIIEFWSTKHPESRYYDDRTREEIIAQYEDRIAALAKEADYWETEKCRVAHKYNKLLGEYEYVMKLVNDFEEKLAALNALTKEVAA